MRWLAPSMPTEKNRPMIGSNSGIRRSRLAHDVHHAMQGASVLHSHQPVALEHELWYPHQHGEEVVEQRRRIGAQELAPNFNWRLKSEQDAQIEFGRGDDLDDTALFDLEGIAVIAEGQSERRGKPVADHLEFGIGIHPLAIAGKPGRAGIVFHGSSRSHSPAPYRCKKASLNSIYAHGMRPSA